MALKLYGDQCDGRLPNLEGGVGTEKENLQHPYWICRDIDKTVDPYKWKNIFGYGRLALGSVKMIDNPVVFYCPADDLWKDIYAAYANPSGWGAAKSTPNDPRYLMSENSSYAQDIIRVTYVYYPCARKRMDAGRVSTLGGRGENMYEAGCPEIALKLADLDSGKSMSADNGGHSLGGSTKASDSPEVNKGHNVLFGDGHVNFQPPPTREVTKGHPQPMHIRQEAEGTTDDLANVSYFMGHLQP